MADQLGLLHNGPSEAMYGNGAIISTCQRYRYRLWRIWDQDLAPTVFVMLNPSWADAKIDDPTIRRCCSFSTAWGAGGIVVVNLFALRSSSPKDLGGMLSPVGQDNDSHLHLVFSATDVVVAAWGAHSLAKKRSEAVMSMIPHGVDLCCLGLTKGGYPKHPLYIPGDTERVPFGPALARDNKLAERSGPCT